MKKIITLSIALLAFTFANAQETSKAKKTTAAKKTTKTTKTASPKIEGAGMVFENETIDYGTIQYKADGNRKFVFTNNGNKPLIITNATGSCGCTVPTSPKEPILPGAKGVIEVKYDTNRVGAFTKTVTVTSNATGSNVTILTTPSATPGGAAVPTGQSTKTLTIKGTVLPDPNATPTTKG